MTKDEFLKLFAQEPDAKAKAALYRALAKQYHPDMGGNDEDMRWLNLAFEDVRAGLDKKNTEDMDAVSDILSHVEDLLKDLGLSYEITGAWIWVESSDRTKAVKDTLKSNGFRWASKKVRWYYAGVPASGRGASMSYIREKYGSQTVTTQPRDDERLSA